MRRRLRFDASEYVVERSRLVVLDVHAHLGVTCTLEHQTERAYSRKTAIRFPYSAGDCACGFDVRAREVDVERDQRPAGPDDDAPRALVEAGGGRKPPPPPPG